MKLVRLMAVSVAVAACSPQITIPARPCILDGALMANRSGAPPLAAGTTTTNTTASQSVFDLFTTLNKTVWSQANIGWLACCQDVPIIPDPDTSVGKAGDITISNTIVESTEMTTAVKACRAAWNARGFTDGRVVIFVHNLIQPDTGNAAQVGISFPTPSDKTRFCTSPPQITVNDVRDAHSFVIEVAAFGFAGNSLRTASVNGGRSDVIGNPGHELGHTLMLSHGNGLDDDQNGVWDSLCDPREVEPPSTMSLMSASGFAINLTTLQIAFARVAAALVPGAVGGP